MNTKKKCFWLTVKSWLFEIISGTVLRIYLTCILDCCFCLPWGLETLFRRQSLPSNWLKRRWPWLWVEAPEKRARLWSSKELSQVRRQRKRRRQVLTPRRGMTSSRSFPEHNQKTPILWCKHPSFLEH